jgi:hypothetical protein
LNLLTVAHSQGRIDVVISFFPVRRCYCWIECSYLLQGFQKPCTEDDRHHKHRRSPLVRHPSLISCAPLTQANAAPPRGPRAPLRRALGVSINQHLQPPFGATAATKNFPRAPRSSLNRELTTTITGRPHSQVSLSTDHVPSWSAFSGEPLSSPSPQTGSRRPGTALATVSSPPCAVS